MSTPENLHAAVGTWTGTSRLWLPEEPTREAPSTALVAPAAQGKFSTIAYTWSVDGEPQEGVLVVGHEPARGVASAVFIDSWHMGDIFMVLRGQIDTKGAIDTRGSYAVEGGPDWGWRTVVQPGNDTLCVVMYNVSPDGEEVLGFELAYTRAA